MAPRAYRKGYLRLAGSYPDHALPSDLPSTGRWLDGVDSETSNRIRYRKVTPKPATDGPHHQGLQWPKAVKVTDEAPIRRVGEHQAINIDGSCRATRSMSLPFRSSTSRPTAISARTPSSLSIIEQDRDRRNRPHHLTDRRVTVAIVPHKGLIGTLSLYHSKYANQRIFRTTSGTSTSSDMIGFTAYRRDQTPTFRTEQLEDHYDTTLEELIERKPRQKIKAPKSRTARSSIFIDHFTARYQLKQNDTPPGVRRTARTTGRGNSLPIHERPPSRGTEEAETARPRREKASPAKAPRRPEHREAD